jgi:hypothetical protein
VTNIVAYDVLGIGKDNIDRSGLEQRAYLRKSGYELAYHQAFRLLENRDYRSIGLIRDPYERLISAFIEKFVRKASGKRLDEYEKLEGFAKDAVLAIKGASVGEVRECYDGISFEDLVGHVVANIENRGSGEPKLNHHWNTQIPFMFLESGFRYDYLYALTDISSFLQRVADLTVGDIRCDHLRKGYVVEDAEKAATDLTGVSSVELSKGWSTFSFQSFFNWGCYESVKKAFVPDYKYLEVC